MLNAETIKALIGTSQSFYQFANILVPIVQLLQLKWRGKAINPF